MPRRFLVASHPSHVGVGRVCLLSQELGQHVVELVRHLPWLVVRLGPNIRVVVPRVVSAHWLKLRGEARISKSVDESHWIRGCYLPRSTGLSAPIGADHNHWVKALNDFSVWQRKSEIGCGRRWFHCGRLPAIGDTPWPRTGRDLMTRSHRSNAKTCSSMFDRRALDVCVISPPWHAGQGEPKCVALEKTTTTPH